MKIGYPCLNYSIGCTCSRTFRLRNYSEKKLIDTVAGNIECLEKTLRYNIENNILFFRITSDLVPFASHKVCIYNWQKHFQKEFKRLGRLIKDNNIRISMHPDQFVLLNARENRIFLNSVEELKYHSCVLDLMELDATAKIQIHLGGVYGDKTASINRFITNYHGLNGSIKKRLVIENDDRSYTASECLYVSSKTGAPVLFDYLHHKANNKGEPARVIIEKIVSTWKSEDGAAMMDYSSQFKEGRSGRHAAHIEIKDFSEFIEELQGFDADIMLEIKDKEKSALEALKFLRDN